ncbi:MAG: hypothetical protein QOI40_1176, partial [Alphaproteobacteria bacterium]|nr:hypothetical protein [Alphaproteobacteria bacterium]
KTAADGVPADKIDRVLVYVPVVDRYVDPAAPAGKQAVVGPDHSGERAADASAGSLTRQ